MSEARRRRRPDPPPAEVLARREFDGFIARFTYRSEDGTFAVARFQAGEDLIPIKGNLAGIAPGQHVRIAGDWREHPDHGAALEVRSTIPLEQRSEAALESYLASAGIRGVGKGMARSIVAAFGEGTLDILANAPERLLEVPKLRRDVAERITEYWRSQRDRHEIMLLLADSGISNALARRLQKHYGNDAGRVLRANPYQVALDVPLIGFTLADRIAEKLGVARGAPARIEAGLVHVLSRAMDDGNTFLPQDRALAAAAELLGCDAEVVEGALQRAIVRGLIVREDIEGVAALFPPSIHRAELELTRHVERLLRTRKALLSGAIDGRIAEFQERFRFELAERQREALRRACEGGIVIVTGGPGTGKTTLVRALLHILRDTDGAVALCSPTGRAAQRLSETTHQQAATIHRLLKFNAVGGKFTHDQATPLDATLVIADEASMIDVPLANALLRALKDGTTLVLVGDADQLPSVGPGAVLRDLIASGRVPCVRLDAIFRQAARSMIVTNSHRIHDGLMPMLPEKAEDGAGGDFFYIRREEPEDVLSAIVTMVTERIPARFRLDPLEQVQVLSPMRRGALGTEELNARLGAALNPEGRTLPGTRLRVGDKVIQSTNNYDLDVFNGDVGRIDGFDSETTQVRVRFGRRIVLYGFDSLDQLQPAFAITIHKSQGSEYPAVVIPVHTAHFVMLRRNLLYTGITRGKKLVVLVGSTRALAMAVRNGGEAERFSALRAWLLRPPGSDELEL